MDGEQQPEAPVPAPEEAQPAEAEVSQESPEQPAQEAVPQDDPGAEGPVDMPSEQEQIMQEHQMMQDPN